MKWLTYIFTSLFLILLAFEVHSETIKLHIPVINDSPKQHLYFHELLNTSIKDIGHTPKLISSELPQLRAKEYLKSGDISIFWMVESTERNLQFEPIQKGITNGLIGKRILFIKKGDQQQYNQVKNLDDFRKLNTVGGMGEDWFDAKVWAKNKLRYKEHSGMWTSIFKMIPEDRDYNYFARGINEILVEAKQYPKLAIEENLVLIYDRDFRFYLSKEGPNAGIKYLAILNYAIRKAKESGLISRLVRKYWANDFEELNYDKRIKIHLASPK